MNHSYIGLTILAAALSIFMIFMGQFGSISDKDYNTVDKWIHEFPEMKSSLSIAIKDGFIDRWEYRHLKVIYNRLSLQRRYNLQAGTIVSNKDRR